MKKAILVILFIFCLSPLWAMDADLWQLPHLPQSQVVWEDRMIEINQIRGRATHLRCGLKAQEILNFYKGALDKMGWEFVGNLADIISTFKKEQRFLYVAIQENAKGMPCDVYLVSSPVSLAICRSLEPYFLKEEIAQDAPGREPADMARYPGSKRRLAVSAYGEGSVFVYESEARPKEIAEFFRKNLQMAGWQEEAIFSRPAVQNLLNSLTDQGLLIFSHGDNTLIINITKAPKNFPGEEKAKAKRSFIIISRDIEKEFSGSKEE